MFTRWNGCLPEGWCCAVVSLLIILFVFLLFVIVDFRKRSVGGGVFGPVPNVLGFVLFGLNFWCFCIGFLAEAGTSSWPDDAVDR